MSATAFVVDLTIDENVAKRPIELLSDDDDSAVEIIEESGKRPRRFKSDDDVVFDKIVVGVGRSLAKSPILQVLEVFPDVCTEHATQLLSQQQNHVATVLQVLAESGSYPKASTKKAATAKSAHALIAHRHEDRTYAYDFLSESSFEPPADYCKEAKQLLQQDFPHLSDQSIAVHLTLSKNHYAICHEKLYKAIMLRKGAAPKDEAIEYQQYMTLQRARNGVVGLGRKQLKNLMVNGKLRKTDIVCAKRRSCKVLLQNEVLKEELHFVQSKQAEWTSRMESFQRRRDARRQAEETSSTIECNCCYADVSPEELVQCTKGHLFCCDCLRNMSETQIFANGNFGIHPITKEAATELLCMAGCGSGFVTKLLKKALSKKVLQKYNEMQFQAAVSKVQMEDLCACPKCGYQAELPATEMIFRCPVGDCGFESCRKCGEEPHIPLKCEEVERKHQTSGRLKVEEAISEARIRTCPKQGCGKKFVKESGCNKMTCACGTLICYICRKQITNGYQHFCQVAHCEHKSCKQCLLYTNADQDDEQAMREAGQRAAEEVRGNSLIGEESKGEVTISVDDILKSPPGAATRPAVAAIRGAVVVLHQGFGMPVAQRQARRPPRRRARR